MLPRPLLALPSRFSRSLHSSSSPAGPSSIKPIDRLALDIHAAANQDIVLGTPQEAVTKSDPAVRGESLRGDVQLPLELQDAVDRAIEQCDDKAQLRLTALDLYAHLRRTSAILPPPASHRDRAALTQTYDSDTSLAFLAGLMPSIYGATLHALEMTKSRLDLLGDGWEPDRVIDFGSGTASAAWAVEHVWGATVAREGGGEREPREYVGLDASLSMVELASSILGALPRRPPPDQELGTAEPSRLLARAHQLTLPASRSSLAKMQLASSSSHKKRTLALTAFTLGDQGTREKRKELVRAMWETDAEVIVVVERGTPGGSRMVLEAREQLLSYGKRSLEWEMDGVEDKAGPKAGSYVLAPCPHDGECPLHHSTKAFCHFSQRVRSPPFLRHTKHTTRGEDDAKFSYVVISRGVRPQPNSTPTTPASFLSTSPADGASLDVGAELAWPRLVGPPLKRSGHVILEACSSNGHLERHTIPKSQGRQAYYDARKAHWGDSFPHPPKNGPQLAPTDPSAHPETTEDKTKRDKFGLGNSKVRSKKWDRRVGEKMWKDEERQRGERAKGRGKKGMKKGEEGEWEGASGGSDGVMEFELDLGPDGQLKMR